MRKLYSVQDGAAATRVVYTKAGTLLSACMVEDPGIVVDHMAYWAAARSVEEARYLCAIINSGAVLRLVTPLQPRGWRDPRHFDNLVWELRIPEYDRALLLHRTLAAAAARAEAVAASVPLREGADFRVHRRAIRDAIRGGRDRHPPGPARGPAAGPPGPCDHPTRCNLAPSAASHATASARCGVSCSTSAQNWGPWFMCLRCATSCATT